ncbi:MAG: anaerobic glycerol-3-phosphate dehydrogenase subunit C [Pirellulaceae bacterium]|jgi:FAD/FMN-containing dehydrogenase/Fe-S oxidoreductase|nr:anaerobic glycerol-3-phosphate dehydrogenase subunit C [Pirellulaceae bacterium]
MDQERERIQADLRGLLDGDVLCDETFVQMYASDASIYQLRPLGVVRPRGVSDVVACVRYAAENEIPLHARGAGTGLAGESIGPGLVVDFSHSMRRVLSVGQHTVRVQPGVVCALLNRVLAERGRCYGPDPPTARVSTIGSVLALNGCGSHWLSYGAPRDTVERLQLVLADGTVVEAARHPLEEPAADAPGEARRQTLVRDLASVLEPARAVVDQYTPRTKVNRVGYQLQGVLEDNSLDLARLVVGSEGTLALITEATLRTAPLPPCVGVVLLFFDRLESAARAALEIAGMDAAACDLMDRRLLSIARETDLRYDLYLPRDAEAMLLVELQGATQDEVRQRMQDVVGRIQRRRRLAFDSRLTLEPDEVRLFWLLVERVLPAMYSLRGTTRPLPFVEDIAVPPAALPDFLVQMQNVLKAHQVIASLFAHAAQGQLHVRPFLDLAHPATLRKLQDVATDLYQQVLDVGGTVSAAHGEGLSRSWFVQQQCGPLYDVFRQIKRIFDPQNILNPGKKVADAPQPVAANLRPVVVTPSVALEDGSAAEPPAAPPAPPFPLQLSWRTEAIDHAARRCNGCGHCRTQLPDERMCPIFRYGPREEATPRAKANLMRALLTGRLDPAVLKSDDLKELADLCVNCHQCRLECPAGVDIPKLMVECKAQYVSTNGLRPTDWFISHLHLLSSWGSRLHPLANWAIGNRQMRWLMERLVGVAQGRKLPRFAATHFLRRAHRRRLTRPTRRTGRKVLYFVDLYANWHDVQLADSLVAVFEHNGVAVYVPPNQLPSGMAAISLGAVDIARKFAAHNVQLLAEAVRQGYHIVTGEPSAALCLTHEYVNLLDDDDARLVAANTSEACTYLWRLHQEGQLELDLKPVNATLGYHLPCHLRALGVGTPGYSLLRLIPGLTVVLIHQTCSGMAGTFGLRRENYRSSLRAGWSLISALRSPTIQMGTTECSACKMQMEQGTSKPTTHPLKLLAMSYGLLPELASLLTRRSEELIVT